MDPQPARFNRILLPILVLLYLISLAAFTYLNWSVEPEHVVWNHILNALILSLPLILFYGAIYVLANAWHEHRSGGRISPRMAKIIHWAPRIAAIVIIFFISLFSLDVFGMGGTPFELLVGFLIHSMPSIAMIVLLIFAWRRPVVGFIVFLLAGIFFLRFVVFDGQLAHFLLFSGPLLLVSALFYADWKWNQPAPPAPVESPITP